MSNCGLDPQLASAICQVNVYCYADYQPAGSRRSQEDRQQDEEPGAAGQPAEARRLRPRLHPDAEEAQFRAPESGARAAHQRHRGHDVHSGCRPQPAGALARADPRRTRQGSSRRSLPRRPGHPRRGRGPGPHAGTVEIRRKAAEESVTAEGTMPRRREIPKRDIPADPLYQSPLVSKFINCVMSDGKRSTAERIIYQSFDIIKEKTGDDPVKVFKKAIDNVKPSLEVKSRRVGGSNYQVPVEVNPNRRLSLSIRWLVGYARQRGDGKTMQEKLANEFMDAANLRGGAVKKREDTHRMAEANKAFAHYRW